MEKQDIKFGIEIIHIIKRPCEGGHVHYSPSNDLETEYLQYLRSKLKF